MLINKKSNENKIVLPKLKSKLHDSKYKTPKHFKHIIILLNERNKIGPTKPAFINKTDNEFCCKS